MSNIGDIQKQLSQALLEAKSRSHKIQDVIPEELLVQFQETASFIKNVESREQDIQSKNANLSDKLKEKEAKIENQPEEFKALKVDLQQAHRSIDYYKDLAEDSERRAARYQRNFMNAVRDKVAADEAAENIQRLQTQLSQHQATILSLQAENARAAEIFDQLRTQDAQAMAENEARLAAVLSYASTVEAESEQFSDTFASLVESLDSEHVSAAASLNTKASLLSCQETLYNALVSEVTPLNSFFIRASSMLQIYEALFQMLSGPNASGITTLSPQLEALISEAASDLERYEGIHNTLCGAGGVVEEEVRFQLHGVSKSATDMLSSFRHIKGDIRTFLTRLQAEPGSWLSMTARFGISRKSKRYSLG